MAQLAAIVAAAVRERQPELEDLIRQTVDVELERVVEELVARELERRRNGGPGVIGTLIGEPESDPVDRSVDHDSGERRPLATKRCRTCDETKPLEAFPPGRNVCKSCTARAARERRRARARASSSSVDDDPVRRQCGLGPLTAKSDVVGADDRRRLLAELRANGVEHELIDGREFTVLRLPDVELERASTKTPIARRTPTGVVQRVA